MPFRINPRAISRNAAAAGESACVATSGVPPSPLAAIRGSNGMRPSSGALVPMRSATGCSAASPAACRMFLAETRRKTFSSFLEEKIRRAQNQK